MNRTREDILSDIEDSTKLAEYFTNGDEYHTKLAKEFKQELKEFDEAQNEQD